MSAETGNSSSKHFRVEKLAEGVYAATHMDGGWMICNTGIVDLGTSHWCSTQVSLPRRPMICVQWRRSLLGDYPAMW